MMAPTDSAETGTRQATIIRPKEVEDNGKSSNLLLPPHIHMDSMHEITKEESPQHSHARLRTPQSFTPQLVNNLTPVLLSTKQSIIIFRPKLHNTNTNRPEAPAITLTNGESSSPNMNPMPRQTLSPSRTLTPLDHLNYLMSCLSIETSNNKEVKYVRIPIHPRTWVAWNQMTQTPSLPLRVDSTIHHCQRRNVKCHARARRVGQHP